MHCGVDGHQTTCVPNVRQKIWRGSKPIPQPFSPSRWIDTARDRRLRCRMGPPCRGCLALCCGYGTMSSAARSAFDGSPARRNCRRTVWATSGIPWCRGNAAAAMRPARCTCCCRTREQRGLRISTSRLRWTTSRRNASSRQTVGYWSADFSRRQRTIAKKGSNSALCLPDNRAKDLHGHRGDGEFARRLPS